MTSRTTVHTLNGSQVRLLGAVWQQRIYEEIGRPWDARGYEQQLPVRVRTLVGLGLVVLGEETDSAGRLLYELTEWGQRVHYRYAVTRG